MNALTGTTGNLVAAMFRHDTSRALDPHLHTHCIVFNATFDAVEKQWKALQNHEMFAAQKFVENVYYHELARELVKFGYQIENKPRGDFEIKGITPELIDKFSKRHKQIDEKRNCWHASRTRPVATWPRFGRTSRTRNVRGKSVTWVWKNCKRCGMVK